MADYGSGQQLRGGSAPSAPAPQGLNPRLLLLRDALAECEKSVFEIRGRLGIPDPPQDDKKRLEEQNNVASVTMDLLARSGRLVELLRSTQADIA